LPGARVENSPIITHRMHDITSWQKEDITQLGSRAKKRYNKRKSAIQAYFTTNASIDEITLRYQLSSKILLQLAEKCLMRHEDGTPWGFRALFPGVTVIDHTPPSASSEETATSQAGEVEVTLAENDSISDIPTSQLLTEAEQSTILVDETIADDEERDTAKRQAINLSLEPSVFDTEVPETPPPDDDEDEEGEPTSKLEPLTQDEELLAEEEPLAASEERALTGEEELISQEEPASASEEEPAAEEEPTAISEEVTPTEPLTVAPQEDQLVVSCEVEDAITEAERILHQGKEPGEDESPTLDIEAEKQIQPLTDLTVGPTAPLGREIGPLIVPVYTKRTYPSSKRIATQRRLVRKRLLRGEHIHHKKKRILQIVSLATLAAILLFIVVPVGAGLAAYSAYSNISAIAHDGVNHLLKVKSLIPVSKTDPTAALNVKNLQQAQIEFRGAQSDFVQLQQLVNRPDVQAAITQFAPQYSNKLDMAQRLVQVALDVSQMGNELSGVALIGANIIHGSPLSSSSNKPVISTADVAAIEGSLVHALYYIDDIRSQMSQVSIKDIPISDSQKAQLTSVLALLPKAQDMITQAQGLIGIVSWLLGVGQQRRFLVQTMDRAELRPSGGFTGQYGILQIQDGRMAPFSLTDVTLIDYAENGTAIGRTAPPGYSWMNLGNWGIRDSNLSGDFPTTARMTMQLYQDEGGPPVDGDIAFTPALIELILNVTGSIKVPGYNETITSKNLEDRLHYYQQDQAAISREKQISGNYTHTGRKAFTSTLGKMLLDRVRHLPVSQLINIFKGAVKDIQSRDLEIYFNNPAAEAWLVQHGYSGALDTFSQQDGFAVAQANLSVSKASQYVHTTEQDNVTLDAQGGATHNLTITLDYQQKGPIYGFDTYADYIRVYAPQNAQFLGGDGFDTGKALCKPSGSGGTPTPTPSKGTPTPVVSGCSQYNGYFPSNARYCPNGNYALGLRYLFPLGTVPWVIDSLGAPTEQTSDLPGRAMWGGLTETPKNCISYISLSWYVPHAVHKVNGQSTYTIVIDKQSGYSPTIELTIDASAIKGLKSFKFTGDINADKAFILSPPPKK